MIADSIFILLRLMNGGCVSEVCSHCNTTQSGAVARSSKDWLLLQMTFTGHNAIHSDSLFFFSSSIVGKITAIQKKRMFNQITIEHS